MATAGGEEEEIGGRGGVGWYGSFRRMSSSSGSSFRRMNSSSGSFFQSHENSHHYLHPHFQGQEEEQGQEEVEEQEEERFYPALSKHSSIYQELAEPPNSPSLMASRIFRSLWAWCLPLIFVLTCSLWLLLGFYGSRNIEVGPNYSRLLSATSLFVREITVRSQLTEQGPMVYEFLSQPQLDGDIFWINVHNTTISSNYYSEWAYWLNKGSLLELKYDILSPDSSLIIAVLQGEDNLDSWKNYKTDSEAALLLQTVTGSGAINFEAGKDDDYYVALGNLHQANVEVELEIEVHAKVYLLDNAVSECSLALGKACSVNIPFLSSQFVVLTTPVLEEAGVAIWPVQVIYQSRWQTYLVVIGLVVVLEIALVIRVIYRGWPKAIMTQSPDSSVAPLIESNREPINDTGLLASSSYHRIDFARLPSESR